jgi:hypothetical protein
MTRIDRESPLSQVADLARARADSPVDSATHSSGRARLMEAARLIRSNGPDRKGASGRIRRSLSLAVAALVLTASLVVFRRYFGRPLDYRVTGATEAGSYVRAREDARAALQFSDGSEIELAAGGRLRVQETRRDGARVLVEGGVVTAHIVHRARTSWSFVAGPFDVHVTGTKLSVDWDAERERIEVRVREGAVEVESPIGPSRYAVSAGHRFRASVRDGTAQLDDDPTPSAASAEVPAAPPAETSNASEVLAGDAAAAAPSNLPHGAPASRAASWSKLVQRGAFSEVVAAAEARGVASCMAECSAPDLRALADAARYTNAAPLATNALLALRSRFHGTAYGVSSAFLLGRTAESSGDLRAAERWYDTYLAEAPSGALAAEALAGKMSIRARAGDSNAVKQLARTYLSRFPEGPAAGQARRLAGPD